MKENIYNLRFLPLLIVPIFTSFLPSFASDCNGNRVVLFASLEKPKISYLGFKKKIHAYEAIWDCPNFQIHNSSELQFDAFMNSQMDDGSLVISSNFCTSLQNKLSPNPVVSELKIQPLFDYNPKLHDLKKYSFSVVEKQKLKHLKTSPKVSELSISISPNANENLENREVAQNFSIFKSYFEGPTKVASYLLVFAMLFFFFDKMFKNQTFYSSPNKRKIIFGRRKKWLAKIYGLGMIDQDLYKFLLRKIDQLPFIISKSGLLLGEKKLLTGTSHLRKVSSTNGDNGVKQSQI